MIDDIRLELASLYFSTADALRAGQLCVADSTKVMLQYLTIRSAEQELDGKIYGIVRGWNRYRDDDELTRAARLDEVGKALVHNNRNELLRKDEDMPLALDADRTVDVVLRTDESKPEETRPAFIFGFISSAQLKKMKSLRDEAESLIGKDDDKARALYSEAIKVRLIGWRNMGNETYSKDAALDFLTDAELQELAWRAPNECLRAAMKLRDEKQNEAKPAEPQE